MTRLCAERNRLLGRLYLLLVLVIVSGCASQNATQQPTPGDPLEPVNRAIYKFNDVADTYVLRPVTKGYEWLLPQFMRTGVSNFFDHWLYPIDIVNAFLQGKGAQGLSDIARFGINSSLGLGGLMDPATRFGLPQHEEDFGQTLGVWGVPEGPYLMVPVFGPRTLRSGVGQLVDLTYDPRVYIHNRDWKIGVTALWFIDQRARLLGFDDEIRGAFDSYAFVRDAYRQNRRFLRYDGNPPSDGLDDEFDEAFDEDEF